MHWPTRVDRGGNSWFNLHLNLNKYKLVSFRVSHKIDSQKTFLLLSSNNSNQSVCILLTSTYAHIYSPETTNMATFKLLICSLLLLAAVAAITSLPPTGAFTVTTTVTRTSTTTIGTPANWLSAQDTKCYNHPCERTDLKEADSQLAVRELEVWSLNPRCNSTATASDVSTVTETIIATATASVYAACLDTGNYVPNTAANTNSAIDGTCICNAKTTIHTPKVPDQVACCNACWADPNHCIGSFWLPDQSCLYFTATTCPTQTYNFSEAPFFSC